MELDDFKQRVQDHFTDGLVTIVGSGLSVAEGIPGMGPLANHLQTHVPHELSSGSKSLWRAIKDDLNSGMDLESTLLKHRPDTDLESTIVEHSASFLLLAETQVVQRIMAGQQTLRFSRLLAHMLKPNTGIPIITTNYDRLIEIAAETVGLGVDTLFVGHHFGRMNSKQSRFSLCRDVKQRRKTVHLTYAEHVVVLKPHGSLDWFLNNDNPIRCPLPLDDQRLIITPGLNKFRGGYDRPFDAHRERANREIDKASRFLIIGYGFNDDHLQTHLEPHLRKGTPTLLLTRGLSQKAEQLIKECTGILAICAESEEAGAKCLMHDLEHFFPGPNLWDLGVLIDEVLEP